MNRYPIQGASVNFGIFSDIGRKALLSVASNLQETGVALQNLGARRKKAAMQTVMSPVYRGAARIFLGKEGFQKHREHKAEQAFLRGHNANLEVLKQNILEKVGDDKPTAHQKKRLEQIDKIQRNLAKTQDEMAWQYHHNKDVPWLGQLRRGLWDTIIDPEFERRGYGAIPTPMNDKTNTFEQNLVDVKTHKYMPAWANKLIGELTPAARELRYWGQTAWANRIQKGIHAIRAPFQQRADLEVSEGLLSKPFTWLGNTLGFTPSRKKIDEMEKRGESYETYQPKPYALPIDIKKIGGQAKDFYNWVVNPDKYQKPAMAFSRPRPRTRTSRRVIYVGKLYKYPGR